MKKKLNIIVLIVSLTFCSLMCVNVYAASDPLDYAKQALWYIIKKADQTFFSRSPKLVVKYNNITSSTGGIEFNTGSIGASTKIQINLNKSNLTLDAFAQTSPLAIFQKISVLLTTPNGTTDVINKSVTHNQFVSYSSKSPYGTYMLRFIENDKQKWDCFYTLYNWDKKLPPSYQSLNDTYTAMSTNGSEINYIKSDDKIYIIPSEDSSKVSPHTFATNSNTYINMDELDNEFFDELLNVYVSDLKNYDVGDEILFKDKIVKVKYDSINNYTSFIFDANDSFVEWRFKNNLTNQFEQGDIIKLKFKVIKEYEKNELIFETIDYFDESLTNSSYPELVDYIIE